MSEIQYQSSLELLRSAQAHQQHDQDVLGRSAPADEEDKVTPPELLHVPVDGVDEGPLSNRAHQHALDEDKWNAIGIRVDELICTD